MLKMTGLDFLQFSAKKIFAFFLVLTISLELVHLRNIVLDARTGKCSSFISRCISSRSVERVKIYVRFSLSHFFGVQSLFKKWFKNVLDASSFSDHF
jgi:hypothetical protein